MTRQDTDPAIYKMVDELLLAGRRWEDAIRSNESAATDKYALRGERIIRALAETDTGRRALETLLLDDSPGVRLAVAAAVVKWAPERAVPVMAALLHEDLASRGVPWEDAGIRMHARILLTEYFGLRLDETIPLPDRLSDMGVRLPEFLVRELRRE